MYKKFLNKSFNLIIKILSQKKQTTNLGSKYGGWDFIDLHSLKKCILISGGVGEDISFDIEFMNKYDAKVIFVDPTPRANYHFQSILKNLGKKNTESYTKDGNQPISSYNLQGLKKESFSFLELALHNSDDEIVRFYPPKDNQHVSYSISNWQNNYDKTDSFMTVKTISIKKIIETFNIQNLEIIKLDIEGAETLVIPDMVSNKIFPNQILVEFDELRTGKMKAFFTVLKIIFLLTKNNYKVIKTNSYPNFLFIRNL